MGWPIDMERKGCKSIGSWTHFVTLNFDLPHDLDLSVSRSNFKKKLYLRNWRVDWHGMKRMWVNRILNPLRLTWNKRMWVNRLLDTLCDHDLQLYLRIGFSRLNFQIAISQEWESQFTWNERDASPIQCWTHYVTLDLQQGLAWRLQHMPSNWLMQNCYFHPMGPLMGCPFSDL